MRPKLVLFQGSYSQLKSSGSANNSLREIELAKKIARSLGRIMMEKGLGLILNGSEQLDAEIGTAAVNACRDLGIDARERVRTYPYGKDRGKKLGFGMVMEPIDKDWQDVRTFIVNEADAVIAISGGKGTIDVIQKASLAQKPVFPIAVVSGGAKNEWERLKRERYFNDVDGDIDFLADRSWDADLLASKVVKECMKLLDAKSKAYSDRIFIVHGHDAGLKNEVARFLEKLKLKPVVLHEQSDIGRTIIEKLQVELADVGYGFILLTPDDLASSVKTPDHKQYRARQNVVFEHGFLMGLLGPGRICAIVKGNIELPSDLNGIIYKHIGVNDSLDVIILSLIKELKAAGYPIDVNRLFGAF